MRARNVNDVIVMQAGRLTLLIPAALAAVLLAGCRNRGEPLEHELRARDIQYREALEEMSRIESHNRNLQLELDAVRRGSPLSPEQAAQAFGVSRIVLGRGTGGYDNDNLPGDEMIQVIIEPRDASDHTIKAPGTLQILVLEINFQGVKVPIGEWTIPPADLHKIWKQTLLSTGYTLRLPWKSLPQSENVRIVARLILPDQRVYEADRDVKIRLVPGRSLQPRELPMQESCPLVVPSLKFNAPALGNQPATHWQAGPAAGAAVQLGRPVPHAPTP